MATTPSDSDKATIFWNIASTRERHHKRLGAVCETAVKVCSVYTALVGAVCFELLCSDI
jgi:hypothetical protein